MAGNLSDSGRSAALKSCPIGVFDSGVGGLTCLKELRRLMPGESFVYLGDTARVPYGTKGRETIARYAREDIAFLERHSVKMIIVACGTVSSVMEEEPVFEGSSVSLYSGVIRHAVAAAAGKTKNKRVGVIGTPATVSSGCYERSLKKLLPDAVVVSRACPLFVPLVENGYTDRHNRVTRLVAEEYLSVIKDNGCDTLIMGCTHYPLLEEIVSDICGNGVTLISPGAEAARYAYSLLRGRGLLNDTNDTGRRGRCRLYCTDSVELFSENVSAFLGDCEDAEVMKCTL